MDIKCYINTSSLIATLYGENDVPMAIQDIDSRANIVDIESETIEVNERAGKSFEDLAHVHEWVHSAYSDDDIIWVDANLDALDPLVDEES